MALISSAVTRYGAPYLGWISKRLSRTTVLLFMIGLLWLLAGSGILRMRDQIEAGVLHDNRNIAIACEHQLIQSLEFIDAALLQIRQYYIMNPETFNISQWQHEVNFIMTISFEIAIAGKTGEIISSTLTLPHPGITAADREHFLAQRDADEDVLFISKPVIGRISNKPTINFTRRIIDQSGEFIGVVDASVDPGYFAGFYQNLDFGPQGFISLVGTDGVVRARSGQQDARIGASLANAPVFDRVLSRESGSFTSKSAIDGVERFFSYRKVAGYPLLIIIGRGTGEMYADFRRNAAVLIATLLGVTLITLCLMWLWNKADTRLDHKRLLLREREQRVRGQFQQLQGTLANIDQGVMTLDATGMVQVINRRAIELLGLPELFSSGPLSYNDIHAFLLERGEYRDIALQLGSDAGAAITVEQKLKMPSFYERERPNGRILEVRTTEIPGGGLVRTFTDITHRKRNERAIAEARDSAETASRTQATFLAMMSHELRTPMNAVIGLTSMLIETSLDQVQRTYARIINTSAEHLLNIINNILDFSRLEAGHEKPEVAVFDLRDMIASVIEIVRSLPNAEGIAISTDVGSDVPVYLRGDSGRVMQVLLNFLSNAVKYTRRGTVGFAVSVTARRDRSVTLRFAVTDTGIGISADALRKLFVPFERGDIVQTSQFGGTGLGLAISKKVVELLGGVVTVESTVGVGSTFACELPFALADQSESRGETARADYTGAVRSLRILAAEDTLANQMVIRAILEKLGHRVQMVGNGAEAVALARETDLDLILMDIQMPVMNGYDAAMLIRQIDGPRGRVPIIALTAFAQAADRGRALTAGMNDYLRKPIRKADVEAIIGKLFNADAEGTTAMPGDAGPDVDEDALDQLRADVGEAPFKSLLEKFLVDLETSISELRSAIAGDNLRQVKAIAHRLCGLCGQFGAMRPAEAAAAVELSAPEDMLGRAATLLDSCVATLRVMRQRLQT